MSDNKDTETRQRAHEIWEREGRPEGRHLEHWQSAERELGTAGKPPGTVKKAPKQANEGEGNRTAAKAYNKHTAEFAKSGKVDAKAREAEKALDGPEGDALKKAEQVGRKKSKGEDPLLGK